MSGRDLELAVHRWLRSCPDAGAAAEWLIARAALNGALPARVRIDRFPEVERALTALFSDRYIAGVAGGVRHVRVADYELHELGESGALLRAVASAAGLRVENRRGVRAELVRSLEEILSPSAGAAGLRGFLVRRELAGLTNHRGRTWRRAVASGIEPVAASVIRYLCLLDHVQCLLDQPGRIERVADVSRTIAGDTHWLRPGTEAWRDLSDDLVEFAAEVQAGGSLTPEDRAAVMRDAGIVENLTSIAVLMYGPLRLQVRASCWRWLEDAMEQRMPLWLSAAHLEEAEFGSSEPIYRVITVENETSFHDLIAASDTRDTVLVLTAGQPNRAVIRSLRLLRTAFPGARFTHQGDLDLAGARILASLQRRCGFDVTAEHMDAETHRRFRDSGIALGEREIADLVVALRRPDLPCQDMLRQIQDSGLRIEQENITCGPGDRL